MRQRKLFRLLTALSPEEFKRCRKAVQSPLFNTNPTVVQLFELLRKQYPDFNSEQMGMEKLSAKLFPKKKYNDSKMRRLFSFLTRVVEDYLVYLELDQMDFQRQKILLQVYKKRDLYDLFTRGTNNLLEELGTRQWCNAAYYFDKIQLEQDKYFHPQHDKYDIKDNTLEDLMDDIDAYFAFTKIQMGIALKNKARILNKPYRLRLLEEVDRQGDGFMQGNLLFELYRAALHLLDEREEVDFEKYQILLFEHIDKLEEEDRKLLFYNGVNYASRQVNKSRPGYGESVLVWYQRGLEKKIMFNNGKISEITFGNIVHQACKMEKFDWAVQFIEKYAPHLNMEGREDEVSCSLALVSYYQKDFKKVIFEAAKCSFKPRYFLRSRNILIRTYFEMFLLDNQDYPFLESAMKSFETHLYRNELFSKTATEPYMNLVKILRGLSSRIIEGQGKEELKDWLGQQLEQRPNVISINWLKQVVA